MRAGTREPSARRIFDAWMLPRPAQQCTHIDASNLSSAFQSFWRSRHAHALEVSRQRAAWDVELVRLSQFPPSLSATSLAHLVSRFLFFARAARSLPRVPPVRSTKIAALEAGDQTRLRQLVKLLLLSYRSSARDSHLGARILTGLTPKQLSAAAASSDLPAEARQWVYQTRRVSQLLLEEVGCTRTFGVESIGPSIMLLWTMIDANQWPLVKDATKSTPEERALIHRSQAVLVQSLVAPLGQAYLPPPPLPPVTTAPAAAASSSTFFSTATSFNSKSPVTDRRARPVIDIFHCLRQRLLDLTALTKDGVPTATQTQQKTTVALMIATVVRCMTVTATSGSATGPVDPTSSPVHLSFLQHILSMPALPQRLRFLGLQALIPSFLTPPLWDRSLMVLTACVRQVNTHTGGPISRAFSRSEFSSPSFTWYDDTPDARATPNDTVASTATSAAVSSSSASGSSSSPMDLSSPPPQYTYFVPSAGPSSNRVRPLSSLAWTFGNLLDFVCQLDETKSSVSSHSFSHFLAAVEQLVRAVRADELPTLAPEGSAAATNAEANRYLPPMLTRQFAVFGERAFLDRLCRRLMAEPAAQPAAAAASASSISASAPAALDDVPVICVLIDSILYRWSASSNSILNTLVFSSDIVTRLWTSIQRSGLLQRIESAGATALTSSTAAATAAVDAVFQDRFFNLLPLFCTMYGHLLLILDDDEFFVSQKPFAIDRDVVPMVRMLKVLLYHLYWSQFASDGTPARLRERFSKLFVQLRDRQTRRQFMPPEAWLYVPPASAIPLEQLEQEIAQEEEMRSELPSESASLVPVSRAAALISSIPFVLPFSDRVRIFYSHIRADKQRQRFGGVQFDHGMGRRIKVRRKFVLEDSFDALSQLDSSEIKGRIQVEFTDEHGLEEAGLDGGGLYRELISSLFASSSLLSCGLFSETSEHFMYPNPAAMDLPVEPAEGGAMLDELSPEHAQQTLRYFYFFGQMVGKAVYDGIQIETQFALFFLRFCVGRVNSLDDLRGLDPVLHGSLMKLKSFKDTDDISELGLTFSVDRQTYGVTRSYDLIPNGSEVAVTNENKVRFIYLMSDYYLNKQMARQSHAFQQGVASILNTDWLRMFAAEEFRLLISGSQAVDRRDLQAHTQYSSGYSKDHELIRWLWEVIHEATDEEVAALLRFATSCSRAPLLGFKHLYPQFCIQVRGVREQAREANTE